MTVSIESFGGKPYIAVMEVLERTINTPWTTGITSIDLYYSAEDRKLNNIEMTDDNFFICGEYRYVAVMPYYVGQVAIPAGLIGTVDIENKLYLVEQEESYITYAHQASTFPGHYEYDNSSGTSTYTDTIHSYSDFEHPDYYDAVQLFEIPGSHIFFQTHISKQNITLNFQTYQLILWFMP